MLPMKNVAEFMDWKLDVATALITVCKQVAWAEALKKIISVLVFWDPKL